MNCACSTWSERLCLQSASLSAAAELTSVDPCPLRPDKVFGRFESLPPDTVTPLPATPTVPRFMTRIAYFFANFSHFSNVFNPKQASWNESWASSESEDCFLETHLTDHHTREQHLVCFSIWTEIKRCEQYCQMLLLKCVLWCQLSISLFWSTRMPDTS